MNGENQLMQGFPVTYIGTKAHIIIDKSKYKLEEINSSYILTEIVK
jgi:hypothetical protein